ncbi:hypothetical protein RND81_13G052000 [Saponaria officinalis]|uniref:Uncharacterized protein n=1 Tax=Saponaria officinalis TaxID=3572 RepID=A0AAW1GX96_SAPOF
MISKCNRGFKLGRKIVRVFKRVTGQTKNSFEYDKLDGPTTQGHKTISKLCKWGRQIKNRILNRGTTRGYIRVGREVVMDTKAGHVPKGHIAIYLGEPDGETRRVLVPVLCINHPLFEKLLKEAENVYGFNYPGQITIPCPISMFESVKTRIATTRSKCRITTPTSFPNLKCLST